MSRPAESLRAALAAALLAACAPARPAPLDARHGEIVFTSRQMGVPVDGRFRRFEGDAQFDAASPRDARIALAIDLASVSMGTADIEAELAGPDWFDVQRHPRASFRSTAVTATAPGRYDVAGTVTLRGVTRDVVVPVTLATAAGITTASGAFTIRRRDFGVGRGDWDDLSLVADEVRVRFTLRWPARPAP